MRNGAVVGSEDYDPYGKDTDWTNYSFYKYANYYYDSYSGFYYLRNRFYDPSIGRFVSEDPVHDGMNWYTYCSGNPIMFVDPFGLAFTLPNYNSNGDDRLLALQALTDDTLDYDVNTGMVVIVSQTSSPTRTNGTELIRILIAEPTVCTIDYTPNNDSYMNPYYDLNGNLISAEILYNPKLNFNVLVATDGGNIYVPETNYIIMGHELVHFYNRIQGNTENMPIPNGNYYDPNNGYYYKGGTYYVKDANGNWITEVNKVEELRTTGITSYHFCVDSSGKQNVYSVIPGKYSENSLRKENNMPLRVKY